MRSARNLSPLLRDGQGWTRRKPHVGVPLLYVAVPFPPVPCACLSALRCRSILAEVQRKVLLGSALALAVAWFSAAIVASRFAADDSESFFLPSVLQRRPHRSDCLHVQRRHRPGGRCAGSDARQFEGNFEALQTSQRQLETLLNSMQDAVIAIGPETASNGQTRHESMVPGRARFRLRSLKPSATPIS